MTKTSVLFAVLTLTLPLADARAVLTTNTWITTSGKWEASGNWSLGTPSSAQSAIIITNGTSTVPSSTKLVTIDQNTVSSAPGSLTISNLFMAGKGSLNSGILNVLDLSNMGATPLQVLNSVTMTNRSNLSITNSTLSVNNTFLDDGDVVLQSGSLSMPNGTMTIGRGGQGVIDDGTWSVHQLFVGDANVGGASFTVLGGTLTLSSAGTLDLAFSAGSTDTLALFGGQLITTNINTVIIGDSGTGELILESNGPAAWLGQNVVVGRNNGSQGTLEIDGGTVTLFTAGGGLDIAEFFGSAGSVVMTDGILNTTNNSVTVGDGGFGQMTVSGGTWLGGFVAVGNSSLGLGTLTFAGGTNDIGLGVAEAFASTGTVWVTGGMLTAGANIADNNNTFGQMTMSNGIWLCSGMEIAQWNGAQGTLTVNGGVLTLAATPGPPFLHVGQGGGNAALWLSGGTIDISGGKTTLGNGGGVGQMTVSNGLWRSQSVLLGGSGAGICTLTFFGGEGDTFTTFAIGLNSCVGSGILTMNGGTLYVTNATHNATLDLESGTITLNGGTIVADKFTQSNPCGTFQPLVGTLVVGGVTNIYSLPFNITAITPQGNDMRITWQTPGGVTNVVQAANGAPDGSYNTNFVDLSPQIIITNSSPITTNYLDIGGATNSPARYYRVRLAP